MGMSDIQAVQFGIDDAAKLEIAHLRSLFEREAKSVSDAVMIGWGEYHLDNGRTFGAVVVSFYEKAQRDSIEAGIRVVNGLEVVLFTIEKYYDQFDGKTLTFESGRFSMR